MALLFVHVRAGLLEIHEEEERVHTEIYLSQPGVGYHGTGTGVYDQGVTYTEFP